MIFFLLKSILMEALLFDRTPQPGEGPVIP